MGQRNRPVFYKSGLHQDACWKQGGQGMPLTLEELQQQYAAQFNYGCKPDFLANQCHV